MCTHRDIAYEEQQEQEVGASKGKEERKQSSNALVFFCLPHPFICLKGFWVVSARSANEAEQSELTDSPSVSGITQDRESGSRHCLHLPANSLLTHGQI